MYCLTSRSWDSKRKRPKFLHINMNLMFSTLMKVLKTEISNQNFTENLRRSRNKPDDEPTTVQQMKMVSIEVWTNVNIKQRTPIFGWKERIRKSILFQFIRLGIGRYESAKLRRSDGRNKFVAGIDDKSFVTQFTRVYPPNLGCQADTIKSVPQHASLAEGYLAQRPPLLVMCVVVITVATQLPWKHGPFGLGTMSV